jgi:hypothetical protein
MTKRAEEEGKRLVWDKGLQKYVEPVKLSLKNELKHYTFPAEAFETLCAHKKDATLAVLLNIVRLWFASFQENPVRLATTEVRGFRVSKDQKSRALTALETVGLISVERQLRKSPLVTLNWKPIKKKSLT